MEILTQLSYLDFRRIPAFGMRFLGFSKSQIDNAFATSLLPQARAGDCLLELPSFKAKKIGDFAVHHKEKLICTVNH